MSLHRTGGIVLTGLLLLATTVSADLIPYNGYKRHSIRTSWLDIRVNRLPSGMVLLFLDESGKLLVKARENESLRIDKPGDVFGAREAQLSTPFSFGKDREKLFKLRTFEQDQIPASYGKPLPMFQRCSVAEAQSGAYVLKCDDMSFEPITSFLTKRKKKTEK